MIRSMTGFGRCHAPSTSGAKDVAAEIKSVNNRFLDVSVRITRQYNYLEEKIKGFLSEKGITRGKIDINVTIDALEEGDVEFTLDRKAAASYIASVRALRNEFDLEDDISVMKIAQNPLLFHSKKSREDVEKDWEDIKPVVAEALDLFISSREKEGEALGNDIKIKLENIGREVERISEISLSNIAKYPEKLTKRIKELLDNFSIEIAEERILTEAAIFADKASIDEEVVRLRTHLSSFDEILTSPENTGRKLDFLLQEINREVNTIASKSQDLEIARTVVDIKTELEKIREQIQNIE